MKSEMTDHDVAAVTKVLKARMAKAACLHLQQVDARGAIALQIAGVFKRDGANSIAPDVLNVLTIPTHPRRVVGALGPFIFYTSSAEPNQQYALNMTSVVLSDDVASRAAAVAHFEALATLEATRLTARTSQILNRQKEQIVSSLAESWQPAAIEFHDAVQEDLLLHFAAVEQSLEQRFDDGLREYLPKVLCPPLPSLEGLELRVFKPSEQRTELLNVIHECADQGTVEAACNQYMRIAGFLPLARDYALGIVIREWQYRHSAFENPWEAMWNWADSTQSPLARYHICMAFLDNPEWGVSGREEVLWREIVEVVTTSSVDDGLHWQREWAFRKELAQHYLRFLESRAPGGLSESLACAAWWLTERIAQLVGCVSEATDNLRSAAIIPEAQNSSYAWRLMLPITAPSALAIATHLGASPWALSMLSRISTRELERLRDGLNEKLASLFESGMAGAIMLSSPIRATQPSEAAIYAFETGIAEAVAAWRVHRHGQAGEELADAISSLYERLSNTSAFVPALQSIGDEDEANQLIIANWARSLAMQGEFPQEDAWKCLTDAAWRKQVFGKVTDTALDGLSLAFAAGFRKNDIVRNAELSHVFASASEEIESDMERKQILFWFAVICGIQSYSVSAIQRLLSGKQRSTYLELLPKLRNWLLTDRNNPEWLTARLRSVLAATSAA